MHDVFEKLNKQTANIYNLMNYYFFMKEVNFISENGLQQSTFIKDSWNFFE